MVTEPNPNTVSDDEVRDVASKLGVSLDNNDDGTEEKEPNSSEKTGTEATEENSSGESDKSKEAIDYAVKYAASTKEFQEKYKPMEENLKRLEQLSGKSLENILQDYTKSSEEQIESKTEKKEEVKEKKDSSKDAEVNEKFTSLEKEVSSLKEKVLEQDERNRLSAKDKVKAFQDKYGVADEDYSRKYQPFLVGIKEMRKPNGDPYVLEEALELSYILANKDNIDKIVDTKIKIRQHEQDLSFSPGGAKQDSSTAKKPTYTEAQLEAARRIGINLEEESKPQNLKN